MSVPRLPYRSSNSRMARALRGRPVHSVLALPSEALRSGRIRTWLLVAVLAAALVATMLPTWQQPGDRFDEGAILTNGVRVLDGAVPYRDFECFYGPGNPYLMAGAFAIAGTDQATERAVGLGYRLLIVLGAAGLLLSVGRVPALAAGGLVVALLIPQGLYALSMFAAVGCALMALAGLALAPDRGAVAMAAGFLAGGAVLMRFDVAPVLAIASLPLLIGSRARTKAFLAGLAPAAAGYLVLAVIAGSARIGRVASDLIASEPARRLPVNLVGSEPGHLLLVVLAGGIAALVAALLSWRSGDPTRRQQARAVTALGLLGLGLVPYALSRLDYVHVIVPLMPAAAAIVGVAGLAAGRVRASMAVSVAAAAGVTLLALLLRIAPVDLQTPVATDGRILLGRIPAYPHRTVDVGGRDFSLLPATAPSVQIILDGAERLRRAGARTLFVGPQDLRRTNLSDAYLYYLLADLRPATYYLDLNPQTANRAGSGFAGELRRADVVILNHEWDFSNEPNGSQKLGSDEPNQVVKSLFCMVEKAPPLELLRRCRNAA